MRSIAVAMLTMVAAYNPVEARWGDQSSAATGTAEAPQIVSTFPANDARIPKGKLIVRVTFDQPMRANSYSFVALSASSYPNCDKTPTQSRDGRSFLLNCLVESEHDYAVGINAGRFRNFVSAKTGAAATPMVIRFSTR